MRNSFSFSLLLLLIVFVYVDATMVGYWKMNEGSGTTSFDSSGLNNNGTLYGASWSGGVSGSALSFDGIDDYVNLSGSALNITGSLTLSSWLYFQDINKMQTPIWKTNQYGFVFNHPSLGGAGTFTFAVLSSSSYWQTISIPVSNFQTGTWYHVAGTFDGTILKLYVNGVQKGSAAYSGSLYSSSWDTRLGDYHYTDHSPGNYYYKGSMDEMAIFNNALSQAEIVTFMNSNIPEPSSMLYFLLSAFIFYPVSKKFYH